MFRKYFKKLIKYSDLVFYSKVSLILIHSINYIKDLRDSKFLVSSKRLKLTFHIGRIFISDLETLFEKEEEEI